MSDTGPRNKLQIFRLKAQLAACNTLASKRRVFLASQGSLASPGRLLLAAVALDGLAKAPVWPKALPLKGIRCGTGTRSGQPTHPDGKLSTDSGRGQPIRRSSTAQ